MNDPNVKMCDTELAEKLRRENCDQFNTLVRMHLSFVLDQNTDEQESIEKPKLKIRNLLPFYKKPKSHNRGIMEGAPLTQEGICQVYQIIEYLTREPNISVEGIFRRTGSLSRQQELRALLNQGINLSLDEGTYSVHDCASVLKGFLAELPEPLLTDAHYATYCQIVEYFMTTNKPAVEQRLLTILQLLLLLLPSENRVLLKDVLDLLNLTAQYEYKNKMSADNLATLFTPHLLCPRKLAPESLHYDSQTLAAILSFMIKNTDKLFQIPSQLSVDIKLYFTKRSAKNKILSPQQQHMDESVSDNVAANTVFSFVDKERTAKENQSNPTETALAQLYAHIQSLPESSKKRKLVKQFNKENGNGTPLQIQRSQHSAKSKSLGESIKKHIFHNKLLRQGGAGTGTPKLTNLMCISEDVSAINSKPRTKLFCTDCDVSSDTSAEIKNLEDMNTPRGVNRVLLTATRTLTNVDDDTDRVGDCYLTSTPAISLQQARTTDFTPSDQSRTSMSPISCSTQRMCKAMQETMMTPRSRKPVLLISRTNICLPAVEILEVNTQTTEDGQSDLAESTEQHFVENPDQNQEMERFNQSSIENASKALVTIKKSKSMGDLASSYPTHEKPKFSSNCALNGDQSLTSTFREYLCSRSVLSSEESPADLSFSSRVDDYNSMEWNDLSEDKLSESLLYCLDGNDPDFSDSDGNTSGIIRNGKRDSDSFDNNAEVDDVVGVKKYILDTELLLKPKQFNERGEPIIFETSF